MKYQRSIISGALLAVALLFASIAQAVTGTFVNTAANPIVMTFIDAIGVTQHTNTTVTSTIDFDAQTGQITSGTTDFNGNPWVADVMVIYQHNPAGPAVQNFNFKTDSIQWFYTDGTDETCHEVTGSGTCAPNPAKTVVFSTGLSLYADYAFSLTAGQVALGTFFDWSTNQDIPVLIGWGLTEAGMAGVNDCYTAVALDTDGDTYPGTAMVTSPFPDQTPGFSGTIGECQTNTLPVALSASAETVIGQEVVITLAAQDPDSTDTLTYSIVSGPIHGTLSSLTHPDTRTASVTYTPDSGYKGNDSFTFSVNDGTGDSATDGTITIAVTEDTSGLKASNFTMINASGGTTGGTNDIEYTWDGSMHTDETANTFNMTLKSGTPTPFFGKLWTAHHVRVFGPRPEPYVFNTTCSILQIESGTCACTLSGLTTTVGTDNRVVPACDEGGAALAMTVGEGQVGAHMLFDYDPTANIDVVIVWDRDSLWDNSKGLIHKGKNGAPPDVLFPFALVSTDSDGDGINGAKMNDGPFIGFSATFNLDPSAYTTDEPTKMTAEDTQISAGCSLSTGSIKASDRSDWLLVLGFLVALGLWRRGNRQVINK